MAGGSVENTCPRTTRHRIDPVDRCIPHLLSSTRVQLVLVAKIWTEDREAKEESSSLTTIVEKQNKLGQMGGSTMRKGGKRWRCNDVESDQSGSGYSIMPGYLDYGIPASRQPMVDGMGCCERPNSHRPHFSLSIYRDPRMPINPPPVSRKAQN